MSRKLKHYEAYLSRLLAFTQAMNLKLIFEEDVPGEGIWSPHSGKIRIDDDMTQSDTIATILHELGHSVTDLPTREPKISDELYESYPAVYKGKAKQWQIDVVVEEEKKAWARGRDIAARLKIRLGKWYDVAEEESIKGYQST